MSTTRTTPPTDALGIIREARARLVVAQGPCSLNNPGLLASSIESVMKELQLSIGTRQAMGMVAFVDATAVGSAEDHSHGNGAAVVMPCRS